MKGERVFGRKMVEESDFGRGLIVCLVKFAEHFNDDILKNISLYSLILSKPKEEQDLVISDNPPDYLNWGKGNKDFTWWMQKMVPIWGNTENALSHEITAWANGASDHLYEIEVPEGKQWDEVRNNVIELRDRMMKMGHNPISMNERIYTFGDVEEINELMMKIVLEIDEIIGLKPDLGRYD